MKQELASNPAYSKIKLVATVYGDDLADKSYREAIGLFEAHKNLKGIIAPTTVGIAAAGKAITDKKLIGKVQLTGLGLPSEMKFYVDNGACAKFALWNPIDLGYTSVMIANALIKKADHRQGRRRRQGRPHGRHQDRRRRRRGHGPALSSSTSNHHDREIREDVLAVGQTILEVRGLSMFFPGNKALEGADLSLR
jgi:hypothetical protein